MTELSATPVTLFKSNLSGGEFEYKSRPEIKGAYRCLRTGDYVVIEDSEYKELKEAFLKMYEISLRYADNDKVFLHNAVCLREKYGDIAKKLSEEDKEKL